MTAWQEGISLCQAAHSIWLLDIVSVVGMLIHDVLVRLALLVLLTMLVGQDRNDNILGMHGSVACWSV